MVKGLVRAHSLIALSFLTLISGCAILASGAGFPELAPEETGVHSDFVTCLRQGGITARTFSESPAIPADMVFLRSPIVHVEHGLPEPEDAFAGGGITMVFLSNEPAGTYWVAIESADYLQDFPEEKRIFRDCEKKHEYFTQPTAREPGNENWDAEISRQYLNANSFIACSYENGVTEFTYPVDPLNPSVIIPPSLDAEALSKIMGSCFLRESSFAWETVEHPDENPIVAKQLAVLRSFW